MTRPVRLVREVRSRLGYLLPLVLIGAGTAAYAPSLDQALQTRPSPPSIGAYEP